jgi:hypothetical protein
MLFTWATTPATAQLPSTDVYLVEMPDEPYLDAVTPTNVTDRRGYDNQPRFSADGRYLYITSIWEDEQADIYRYEVGTGVMSRVTFTMESEYSPTPGPGYLDLVRVEEDGRQRLWRYDPSHRRFDVLLPGLEPVGYFGWIDDHRVAAFLVGEPHHLVLAQTTSAAVDTLAADVGRTIAAVPGRNAVSFVQKGQSEWSIDMVDFDSGRSGTITPTLPGREDYAWTPDGRILMADGSVIYIWSSGEGTWERFIDFSAEPELGEISRLAVSPTGNLLSFVAERTR